MVNIFNLSISDFRTTFRDPIFKILLFFPFAVFALIKWLLPLLEARYPVIKNYDEVISMWASVQSATMFGFIYGFLFLEEKEEDVWTVIRITPVSLSTIIFARLLFGFLISSLVNYFLIRFGGVIFIDGFKELLLSMMFSLVAPLIAMTLGGFAKNRIEGLAIMKIVNLLLIIPALIYFIDSTAIHVTCVIPTYWSYRAMEQVGNGIIFYYFIGIAVFVHLLYFNYLLRRLVKE